MTLIMIRFTEAEIIGAISSAAGGIDFEPDYARYAIFQKVYIDKQIVSYDVIPFVYHQAQKIILGIIDSEGNKVILTTEDMPERYVAIYPGINDYTNDFSLIRFGCSYYMRRQKAYNNVENDSKRFTFKSTEYRVLV